uniref:cell surface glycoprotein CD200 receptor 2-like isoform X2 n=1 Tax=Myodes glareolus TaxID=447135 RepID=UPI0020204173|nr:cell surface glycoprotein CD200 receptor 2-like isoform X2 [Myodes glareolus]
MNAVGRTSVLGLLISITILAPDSSYSNKGHQQEPPDYQLPGPWMDQQLDSLSVQSNTTLYVEMGTKSLLSCPAVPLAKAVLITWLLTPRGQPSCRISYTLETKETSKIGCTDRRITWASTPEQSPDLQISAVALSHDGYYSCQITTPDGDFQEGYDLQVLVPPEVTLFPGENRTAVCEAIAGKPAAQIFWTPDGNHVTKKESHSNGTVTVRSTYHWEQNNMSAVFCFVSHPTGTKLLSTEQNRGVTSTPRSLLTILYVKLSLLGIILLIIGFAFFQKRNYFRK